MTTPTKPEPNRFNIDDLDAYLDVSGGGWTPEDPPCDSFPGERKPGEAGSPHHQCSSAPRSAGASGPLWSERAK